MSCKKTQHTKQFKLDAINYRKEHPDLTLGSLIPPTSCIPLDL